MSDSIRDLKIKEYLGRLASRAATPGGGAAAALTSAQGAALVMMVANHTIGKPEYAGFEELNRNALDEAETLLQSLTDGIDNDADAFGKVAAAYAMPRGLGGLEADRISVTIEALRDEGYEIGDAEEEMSAEIMDQIEAALVSRRSKAIAAASAGAAEAPLMVMEDSLAALRLAAGLMGRSNRNLESDLFVAAHCLYAGMRSAKINVDVNLKPLWKADPYNAHLMDIRAAEALSAATVVVSEIFHAGRSAQEEKE